MKTLNCEIISISDGFSSPNYEYRVCDESNGETVSKGVSSSENFVRSDAGGYHTKETFDKLYPEGWKVEYDF